ncbi:MAG: hypothetical protein ABIO02_03690, partial [Patescibacteria group bacterium]
MKKTDDRINLDAYKGILKNLMAKTSEEMALIQEKLLHLPRFNLNARQICDLELLMNGGFSPL